VSVAEDPPEAAGISATYFVVEPNREQLLEISRLADDGDLHPAIDSVFPLADAPAATVWAQHVQRCRAGRFAAVMLFLKRCSDVFEERWQDILDKELAKGRPPEEAEKRANHQGFYAETFFVPPSARWNHIRDELHLPTAPRGSSLRRGSDPMSS